MIKPIPTMTNAERQRKFRQNNPGYYARLRAKRLPARPTGAPSVVAMPTAAGESAARPIILSAVTRPAPADFTLAAMAA